MKDVITIRRELHKIPELSHDLPKTITYVKQLLSKLSCEVFEPSKSAVCAFFDMGKTDTIAYRADMDALPIHERSEVAYVSTHQGQMHACGHDGHTAMLLAFAGEIDKMQDAAHNVLLIFEPAEETVGGALEICSAGVLEKYNVTSVFAIHLWPGLETGQIATRYGALMARTCVLNINFFGKSVHIAKAHEGADAILAASCALQQLYKMEREDLSPEVFRLLKFGRFEGGTVRNALAASAVLKGSLRAFDDDTFEMLKRRVREISSVAAAENGCTVEIFCSDGYPAVINDEALLSRALKLLGEGNVEILSSPSMTAEDFSFFGKIAPAVMFFLGTGRKQALHSDCFDFDEDTLQHGISLFKKLLFI